MLRPIGTARISNVANRVRAFSISAQPAITVELVSTPDPPPSFDIFWTFSEDAGAVSGGNVPQLEINRAPDVEGFQSPTSVVRIGPGQYIATYALEIDGGDWRIASDPTNLANHGRIAIPENGDVSIP